MKVIMSKEGKILHDNLIDSMSSIDYINFDKLDGKNKIFHITISSKKIKNIFNDLLNYVSYIPCDFNCNFDNICIYKWENNTWLLHKEYLTTTFMRIKLWLSSINQIHLIFIYEIKYFG